MDKACEMSSDEKQLNMLLPPLYRFALYMLGNSGHAEKLVSDSCVAVYRKTVGRGFSLEQLKVRYFRRLYFRCLLCLVRYDPQSILAASTKITEDNKGLICALGQISRRERAVIALRFICGFKGKELPAVCLLPQRVMRNRFAKATKKLRSLLCEQK